MERRAAFAAVSRARAWAYSSSHRPARAAASMVEDVGKAAAFSASLFVTTARLVVGRPRLSLTEPPDFSVEEKWSSGTGKTLDAKNRGQFEAGRGIPGDDRRADQPLHAPSGSKPA